MFKLLYRLNAHNLLAFATKFREPYHNTETCYILHAHSHAPQTLLLKLPVTALFLIIRGSNLYSYEPSSTQQFVSTHNITLSTDCNIHKQKRRLVRLEFLKRRLPFSLSYRKNTDLSKEGNATNKFNNDLNNCFKRIHTHIYIYLSERNKCH